MIFCGRMFSFLCLVRNCIDRVLVKVMFGVWFGVILISLCRVRVVFSVLFLFLMLLVVLYLFRWLLLSCDI